ncbi:hypothetical protein MMC10_007851 [Thelotrema lepadinum]|nr:hypothetical protein [Thelotrema lepadinum]
MSSIRQNTISSGLQSDGSRRPPPKDRMVTQVSYLDPLLLAPFIVVVLSIVFAFKASAYDKERASLTRLRGILRGAAALHALSEPATATYFDGFLEIHKTLEPVWKKRRFSSRARDLPRELKEATLSTREEVELQATERKRAIIEPHFQHIASKIDHAVSKASKKYPEFGRKIETIITEIKNHAANSGGLDAVIREMKNGPDMVNLAATLMIDDEQKGYKDAVVDIEQFLWQKIRDGYVPLADFRNRKTQLSRRWGMGAL